MYEMSASRILEYTKIDNPEFIKQYLVAMDTPAKEFQLEKRTKTTITVAVVVECKRLGELRHK